MIFICSMIDPGHPCVTMSGNAFSCFERTWMKVNVQPVDLGDEVRYGVQLRLDLAPVVVRRPVARERLNRRELHALRVIRDRFPLGPPRRVDAPAQFGEIRFRKIHLKRTDGNLHRCPFVAQLDSWLYSFLKE